MINKYRYKCVRDYMECEDAVKDIITGRLFATKFVRRFCKGETYRVINLTDTEITLQNEYGGKTTLDNKMACNFFELEK